MTGRAGRRGLDTNGNIVFKNINYEKLIKGYLPNIVGTDNLIENNYQCSRKDVSCLYENYMNHEKKIDMTAFKVTSFRDIQWFCRRTDKIDDYLLQIEFLNLRKDYNEEKFLKHFCTDVYIYNYKTNSSKYLDDNIRINRLVMTLYNKIRNKKYDPVKRIYKQIFMKTKKLIMDYYSLNDK